MTRMLGLMIVVAMLVLLAGALASHAMRCGNDIVGDGSTKLEVLNACGEPIQKFGDDLEIGDTGINVERGIRCQARLAWGGRSIAVARYRFDPVGNELTAVWVAGLAAIDAVKRNFGPRGIPVTAGGAHIAKEVPGHLAGVAPKAGIANDDDEPTAADAGSDAPHRLGHFQKKIGDLNQRIRLLDLPHVDDRRMIEQLEPLHGFLESRQD